MRITRAALVAGVLTAALAAGTAAAGPGVGLASTARSLAQAGPGPGSVLWTSVHPAGGRAVVANPKGGQVFVAGSGYLTAVNPTTGATLWTNSAGGGQSVAVSQDGTTVFVIKSVTAPGGANFWTAAFGAATGKELWARQYNGRANGTDRPAALAVSPNGKTVFVTGTSQGASTGVDYATVAYASASGRQLWAARYNGHGRSRDFAAAIAVDPIGESVFVTGYSFGGTIGASFATIAYSAMTGKAQWTKRYSQPDKQNAGSSLAVSPDGRQVFVTGESSVKGEGNAIATVAYAARTGALLWARRYHAAQDRNDSPAVVLTSPRGGGTVLVAGSTTGTADDFVVLAYNAANGQVKWARRFTHPGFQTEDLGGAALSADGRVLYLAGSAFVVPGGEEPAHSLTFALNAHTGAQLWSTTVSTKYPFQVAGWISLAPGGSAVYIGVADQIEGGAQEFTIFALRT